MTATFTPIPKTVSPAQVRAGVHHPDHLHRHLGARALRLAAVLRLPPLPDRVQQGPRARAVVDHLQHPPAHLRRRLPRDDHVPLRAHTWGPRIVGTIYES